MNRLVSAARTGVWAALLLSLPSLTALAVDPTRVVLSGGGNLASVFWQDITLELPVGMKGEDAAAIIYGVDGLVHQRTTKFFVRGNDIHLKIVPPTYLKPIQFRIESTTGRLSKVVSQISFTSRPIPFANIFPVRVDGDFSAPFFFTALALPTQNQGSSQKKFASFAAVVNKWGELIWMHSPGRGSRLFDQRLVTKPLGPNRFGILVSNAASYFEVVDASGIASTTYDFRAAPFPIAVHSDFDFVEGRLLALSHQRVFQRTVSDWRTWLSAPVSHRSSTLVSFATDPPRMLWRVSRFFSLPSAVSEAPEEEARHFVTWGSSKAAFASLDVTSFAQSPYGTFIVLPHRHKVALLSDQTPTPVWSLGEDEGDSLRWPEIVRGVVDLAYAGNKLYLLSQRGGQVALSALPLDRQGWPSSRSGLSQWVLSKAESSSQRATLGVADGSAYILQVLDAHAAHKIGTQFREVDSLSHLVELDGKGSPIAQMWLGVGTANPAVRMSVVKQLGDGLWYAKNIH